MSPPKPSILHVTTGSGTNGYPFDMSPESCLPFCDCPEKVQLPVEPAAARGMLIEELKCQTIEEKCFSA